MIDSRAPPALRDAVGVIGAGARPAFRVVSSSSVRPMTPFMGVGSRLIVARTPTWREALEAASQAEASSARALRLGAVHPRGAREGERHQRTCRPRDGDRLGVLAEHVAFASSSNRRHQERSDRDAELAHPGGDGLPADVLLLRRHPACQEWRWR